MKLTNIILALIATFTPISALRPGHTHWTEHMLSPQNRGFTKLKHATYAQLIDHNSPELGTFEQFYYYDDTHWAGPGSPVVLTTPGEESLPEFIADSLASTSAMPGAIAKAIGGAIVIIEHRYYGKSSPVTNLTTANLKFLNVKQVISDFTRFANLATLPFDPKGTSRANKAPWVYTGCSYAGALAGWIASTAPGTFWAYQGSSAVVETIRDFWEYFVPIEQGTPANCLNDIRLVVEHVDKVLTKGSASEKQALKSLFRLEGLQHDQDFASAIVEPIFNSQFERIFGPESFCNFIENVKNPRSSSGPYKGVSLEKALHGYAHYFKNKSLKGACESFGYRSFQGEFNVKCFDSFDKSSPIYTDTSVQNAANRQYLWLVCNQPFGFFASAPPKGRPSIVSSLVTPAYQERTCGLFFPPGPDGQTFGSNECRTEAEFNRFTQGWNFVNSTRLVWGNSQFDPYRESTVSADFRPHGPLKSTPEHPVFLLKGGYHCGDYERFGSTKKNFDAQVQHLKKWVDEFPGRK